MLGNGYSNSVKILLKVAYIHGYSQSHQNVCNNVLASWPMVLGDKGAVKT